MLKTARSALARAVIRRFALALGVSVLATIAAAAWVVYQDTQAAAEQQLRDARGYAEARIFNLERDWEGAAFILKATLEYSRFLEDPARRASAFVSFLEAQGGSRQFELVIVTDARDRLLLYYPEELRGVIGADALSTDARWVFSSELPRLYRRHYQRIWLGPDGSGNLYMLRPVDNALLHDISYPGIELGLVWHDRVLASSLGADGIASGQQLLQTLGESGADHLIEWPRGVPGAPKLLVWRTPEASDVRNAVAFAVAFGAISIAMLAWWSLGGWLRTTVRRVLALAGAAEGFLRASEVTPEAHAKLGGANPGGGDEINQLGLGLETLMQNVVRERKERDTVLQALRHSEQKFRDLAQLSSDWFWEQDAELRFTGMSDEIYSKTRLRPQATLGKLRWELPIVGVSDEQWRAHRELLERREPFTDFVYQMVNEAGELRWFSINGKPVFDYEGRFHGYRGTGRDITRQREAEEALRRNEGRLRQAVRVSDIGIFDHDHVRDTIYWSPEQRKIYGFGADEPVTLAGFIACVFDEDRERIAEAVRRAHDPGGAGIFDVEHRIVRRDGTVRWISTRSQTLFEGEGAARAPLRTVGAIVDITERKRVEEEIRQSERRFRALVDLSSDWYWEQDTDYRFTYRQGAVLEKMGLPVMRDIGKTRWELDFPSMSEADWAAHRALLDRREEFRDLLLERRSPDGRIHWATISGGPMYDTAGKFIGYHGIGRDVTAQVQAEQALRQLNIELERKVTERTAELATANRELEAFAYSVSHDLRAPLRGIDGFSQLLVAQYSERLDAEGRRMLGRVRAAAQHMGRLIEDLLELSRVSRGAIRSERVDLSALAQAIAADLDRETKERTVEWRIEPGMTVHGDAGLLRIALANLLGNAFKYTRDAAHARIEFGVATRSDGRVEFYVRDNGAGFDMAYADKLFQPFQRLHASHEFEGTGIGLATVQRVVARHGGEIRGEGSPGAGATFRFTLTVQ